ncbi:MULTISPECIES: dienelactone hydrolase family protein [Rhodopirellula]|uniref:dienelactone hydrolase family protein n=1 Tax=Rhodopirellula TaxID=265488 RepID=UPI0030EB6DDD
MKFSPRHRCASIRCVLLALMVVLCGADFAPAQLDETLPSLVDGRAPENFEEMWRGFDPTSEPLNVEVVREWEEDGVDLKIVRFRMGVFKGHEAKLAAVFGVPKGATNVPGLVQIHGGGQFADYKACVANAKRGYATVSIAWAGRISAPGHRVSRDEVKLFWDQKTDDPAYRLTTDWGVVDGYHAPSRNPGNQFPSAKPGEWTLDDVESPRNSGWFLCAIAARRALTFLESQPEVDANRLGVYGHSMGGKLTVLTAVDPRVKAAAPSCGGISDRYNDSELFRKTLGDDVSLSEIQCPIMFLSPANDFHGRIGDLPSAVSEIQSQDWRVTCSPHHNHQDTPAYEAATLLWFDQHLKNAFQFPQTPKVTMVWDGSDGVPKAKVQADASMPIESVDVYYTQNGKPGETPSDRDDVVHRFWHHVSAAEGDDAWTAKMPISSTSKPLWVYANVTYRLSETVEGVGYYYRTYRTDEVNLSSVVQMFDSEQLRAAGVKATKQHTNLIEDFASDWEREWFTYRPEQWARTTNKLSADQYKAPANAKLTLEVQSVQANSLVAVIDEYAATVELDGGETWQTIELTPGDFQNAAAESLANWEGIRQLKLSDVERLTSGRGESAQSRIVGQRWKGEPPQFRNLRWTTQAADSANSRLDVFPGSTVGVESVNGETKFQTQYSPSPSVWDDRIDEAAVFQVEMQHQQSPADSFRLRMGKGGQIYSLRGSFGESLPPSWRKPGGKLSPWNDEVWQFVAVCTQFNGIKTERPNRRRPEQSSSQVEEVKNKLAELGLSDTFFVHNSGAYIPNSSELKSLYCPLLAYEIDEDARAIRMLNWGLVPQIRSVHRSPLLYYTQIRDAGDGVIEMTWVVHNFSQRDDVVFDHLNAPWGGTRISSLPLRYVASPEGELLEREGFLSEHGTVDVRETAGWNLSCQSNAEDSPSLALVYGRDKHLERELERKANGEAYCQFKHSLYRDWRASDPLYKNEWKDWATRPENSFRNYDVCEIIPKLRIVPGSTIWFRSYLVVGEKVETMKRAQSLVDHVDYGLLDFSADQCPMTTVVRGGVSMQLFAKPVSGSLPVFEIEHAETGQNILTTDPYYFVENQPLDLDLPSDHPQRDYFASVRGYFLDRNHSKWKRLVGYAMVEPPAEGGSHAKGTWKRLSSVLNSQVAAEDNKYHRDVWVQCSDTASNVEARATE